jgi:sterol desaturase/sphingolipid hydroxylase (fatty acid hydroxylase superfamily)
MPYPLLDLPLRLFVVALVILCAIAIVTLLNTVASYPLTLEKSVEQETGEQPIFTPAVKTAGQWLTSVIWILPLVLFLVIILYKPRY